MAQIYRVAITHLWRTPDTPPDSAYYTYGTLEDTRKGVREAVRDNGRRVEIWCLGTNVPSYSRRELTDALNSGLLAVDWSQVEWGDMRRWARVGGLFWVRKEGVRRGGKDGQVEGPIVALAYEEGEAPEAEAREGEEVGP